MEREPREGHLLKKKQSLNVCQRIFLGKNKDTCCKPVFVWPFSEHQVIFPLTVGKSEYCSTRWTTQTTMHKMYTNSKSVQNVYNFLLYREWHCLIARLSVKVQWSPRACTCNGINIQKWAKKRKQIQCLQTEIFLSPNSAVFTTNIYVQNV